MDINFINYKLQIINLPINKYVPSKQIFMIVIT